MKLKSIILSLVAATAMGTAASAATIHSVTEGDRDHVVGSILAPTTGSGAGDTNLFDLSGLTDLSGGDSIEIYGRIIGFSDTYIINTKRDFRVDWIFNGYVATDGDTGLDYNVVESGFVATPFGTSPSADATITMEGAGGTTDAITDPFSTDITASTGGEMKIFSSFFDAGEYELVIAGLGSGKIDSLYDIRITAVPVPAGGLLLLTGLAGLAAVRRRRG